MLSLCICVSVTPRLLVKYIYIRVGKTVARKQFMPACGVPSELISNGVSKSK